MTAVVTEQRSQLPTLGMSLETVIFSVAHVRTVFVKPTKELPVHMDFISLFKMDVFGSGSHQSTGTAREYYSGYCVASSGVGDPDRDKENVPDPDNALKKGHGPLDSYLIYVRILILTICQRNLRIQVQYRI